MDHFEMHEEATRLADTHSAYMLAKMLLIEQKESIDLAAHVERLREDVYDQASTILGEFGVRETIDDYLPDSYNETPATSLARRDLIKQAEVLEYMGEEVSNMHPKANKDGIAAHLTHISRGYRQQANQLKEGPCQS